MEVTAILGALCYRTCKYENVRQPFDVLLYALGLLPVRRHRNKSSICDIMGETVIPIYSSITSSRNGSGHWP